MILANHVPIAEDELFDYFIEDVIDMCLQNQVCIMNFRLRTELLKIFEKFSLDSKRSSDPRQKRDVLKSSTVRTEMSVSRGKSTKCYRCHEMGHVVMQ